MSQECFFGKKPLANPLHAILLWQLKNQETYMWRYYEKPTTHKNPQSTINIQLSTPKKKNNNNKQINKQQPTGFTTVS